MNNIKKVIKEELKKYNNDEQFRVVHAKDRYSTSPNVLFIGTYDECLRVIQNNPTQPLEMVSMGVKKKVEESAINESIISIIGSRTFNNYSYAKTKILDIIKTNKISVTRIISGGAQGSDKIAEKFAETFKIPIEVITPDWSKGKSGGVIRNTDIINKSDCVIAFWDGKSKGTLDSINKAKRGNKKLFVVNVSSEGINEGVTLNDDGTYEFNFNKDEKSDLLSLKYNKGFITKKTKNGIVSYFSYKVNRNLDKNQKNALLGYIKKDLKDTETYERFLSKSVIGLLNNPNIEIGDTDLILIPQSGSEVNKDLAIKIKNKLPNAIFINDAIIKNVMGGVTVNYDKIKSSTLKPEMIIELEDMIRRAEVDSEFKLKKIPPRFRKYIINFLQLNTVGAKLMNKICDGKILIVDDIVSEGTTFNEINRLMETFAPKEIIFFSLIG